MFKGSGLYHNCLCLRKGAERPKKSLVSSWSLAGRVGRGGRVLLVAVVALVVAVVAASLVASWSLVGRWCRVWAVFEIHSQELQNIEHTGTCVRTLVF